MDQGSRTPKGPTNTRFLVLNRFPTNQKISFQGDHSKFEFLECCLKKADDPPGGGLRPPPRGSLAFSRNREIRNSSDRLVWIFWIFWKSVQNRGFGFSSFRFLRFLGKPQPVRFRRFRFRFSGSGSVCGHPEEDTCRTVITRGAPFFGRLWAFFSKIQRSCTS